MRGGRFSGRHLPDPVQRILELQEKRGRAVLPDVDIPWRDVWFGSAVTSGLFCLGKWLIGFYLTRTNAGSAYGTAGALVLITLWVYYASFLLLFGAEFTRVFSRSVFASRRHATVGAKRVRITRQEIRDNPRRGRG